MRTTMSPVLEKPGITERNSGGSGGEGMGSGPGQRAVSPVDGAGPATAMNSSGRAEPAQGITLDA